MSISHDELVSAFSRVEDAIVRHMPKARTTVGVTKDGHKIAEILWHAPWQGLRYLPTKDDTYSSDLTLLSVVRADPSLTDSLLHALERLPTAILQAEEAQRATRQREAEARAAAEAERCRAIAALTALADKLNADANAEMKERLRDQIGANASGRVTRPIYDSENPEEELNR